MYLNLLHICKSSIVPGSSVLLVYPSFSVSERGWEFQLVFLIGRNFLFQGLIIQNLASVVSSKVLVFQDRIGLVRRDPTPQPGVQYEFDP